MVITKKINTPKNLSLSTEEKIKSAARTVFTKKGYAATRTRDIAEEAGINLALLNYYFRSKEKLFELIMFESAGNFFVSMKSMIYDEKTSLEKKIELLVANYIDLLIKEPNFPFFILSEIQANPEKMLQQLGAREVLEQSVFFKQLKLATAKRKVHPIHYLMNILSMTVFPFIAKPVLKTVSNANEKEFNELMLERKKKIPIWIKIIMDHD